MLWPVHLERQKVALSFTLQVDLQLSYSTWVGHRGMSYPSTITKYLFYSMIEPLKIDPLKEWFRSDLLSEQSILTFSRLHFRIHYVLLICRQVSKQSSGEVQRSTSSSIISVFIEDSTVMVCRTPVVKFSILTDRRWMPRQLTKWFDEDWGFLLDIEAFSMAFFSIRLARLVVTIASLVSM